MNLTDLTAEQRIGLRDLSRLLLDLAGEITKRLRDCGYVDVPDGLDAPWREPMAELLLELGTSAAWPAWADVNERTVAAYFQAAALWVAKNDPVGPAYVAVINQVKVVGVPNVTVLVLEGLETVRSTVDVWRESQTLSTCEPASMASPGLESVRIPPANGLAAVATLLQPMVCVGATAAVREAAVRESLLWAQELFKQADAMFPPRVVAAAGDSAESQELVYTLRDAATWAILKVVATAAEAVATVRNLAETYVDATIAVGGEPRASLTLASSTLLRELQREVKSGYAMYTEVGIFESSNDTHPAVMLTVCRQLSGRSQVPREEVLHGE